MPAATITADIFTVFMANVMPQLQTLKKRALLAIRLHALFCEKVLSARLVENANGKINWG